MAKMVRPPVIAVMGHIDHGKSSLLDYIRKATVTSGEAGGITQHVSAYIAEHGGRQITFLDTPGHEAFTALRERGAAAADIAILVVAADEGVMPQTLGALKAIKESNIPFVIAITKIDKNNADITRVKNSLLEHEIAIEGFGGDIAYTPVSSKTGEGVPDLLDLVLLTADINEIQADPELPATGFVLESTQDQKKGVSATLIIKDGTLTTGSFVVAGDAFAPVRFIENFLGKRIDSAGPSLPVRISGFSTLPSAGSLFSVVANKKEAEAEARKNAKAFESAPRRVALADGVAELPLIIKTDVAGSIDAVVHEFAKITHERAVIHIVSSGVGNVSESDVKTARASGGIIIAFNVGTDAIARELAERDGISIFSYSIIYELSEKVTELLTACVPVIVEENELGRALVLKPFSASGKKQVLGARYISGTLSLKDRVKLVRKGVELGHGSVANLQQARMDVKEIKTEGDFGTELELREPVMYGDEIIAFTTSSI